MENMLLLMESICQIGTSSAMLPQIQHIEPFEHFFISDSALDMQNIDRKDGCCTRRELILRYLVLNAVLDQGPDIVGVRQLLIDVTNHLYQKEIRFLHNPALFFKELGIAIDQIIHRHESIKAIRSVIWAAENQSTAAKYNLFMDNCKQVLNYAVFRWGVPLALPLLLERDEEHEEQKHDVLYRHLKGWRSAEQMSQELKDNEKYGLGKAIGDKACHLFAKWAVSSFSLLKEATHNWNSFSFEVPFDSNAGRVLWRTGFFLKCAPETEYVRREVVQKGQGKGGLNYIRVTNIRGMKAQVDLPGHIWEKYVELSCRHLCTHSRQPKSAEIQRIPHGLLMGSSKGFGIAEFDEGLIHLGTRYCFNHDKPKCDSCPIGAMCEGKLSRPELIADYRT